MKFSVALAAILLPVAVNAQYDSGSSTTAAGATVPSAPPSTSSSINVRFAFVTARSPFDDTLLRSTLALVDS